MIISQVAESDAMRAGDSLFDEDQARKDENGGAFSGNTQGDLVILYKNCDVGTEVDAGNAVIHHRKSNQHVVTIVYQDDEDVDDSEASEINSAEDLNNVLINNKDQINHTSSSFNPLCQKHNDIEGQRSVIPPHFNKHYILQEQLKTQNFVDPILPASLLDYICCKRLEDNYNFYMDNIINYVKNTIEQLKRISNGDYLTDKAKEKWRETKAVPNDDKNNMKILSKSTSIPLHVECKASGSISTWDDIVHSEVDLRSLSKILEKKIVLEIPKMIRGTYNFFRNHRKQNFVISCTKRTVSNDTDNTEPRVDVIVKLQRSISGHMMSNINSVIILKTQEKTEPLPLPYISRSDVDHNTPDNNIEDEIYLNRNDDFHKNDLGTINSHYIVNDASKSESMMTKDLRQDEEDEFDDNEQTTCSEKTQSIYGTSNTSPAHSSDNFNEVIPPDDLICDIQQLKIDTLAEETSEDYPSKIKVDLNKKKSPTRNRVKSPYENKLFLIEEKKRKRLLEIREKREKRKLAIGEKNKMNKYKHSKGVMPQSSNSVTKLSITNKSFYNSIYGHAAEKNVQYIGKIQNAKNVSSKNSMDILDQQDSVPSTDRDSQRYINRSYYLDDAITEVMHVDDKHNNDFNDSTVNLLVSEKIDRDDLSLTRPSTSKLRLDNEQNDNISTKTTARKTNNAIKLENIERNVKDHAIEVNVVPTNTPKSNDDDTHFAKSVSKKAKFIECKKSIERIYELMQKIETNSDSLAVIKSLDTNKVNTTEKKQTSTVEESDSGTSLKHQLTSSNPSCFSFDKKNNVYVGDDTKKKQESDATIQPKVIITAKPELPGNEDTKIKKKRVVFNHLQELNKNPLKAISQLLHEFENVQMRKENSESYPKRRDISGIDNKSLPKRMVGKSNIPQRIKPLTEVSKAYQQHPAKIDKIEIPPRKKFVEDVIDEIKEARGEAIKGPSKIYSRLDTLAQPKKSYVQAHKEEYQNRYSRNYMMNRMQRLPASPTINNESPNLAKSRGRPRRSTFEAASTTKNTALPSLGNEPRSRRTNSNSPENKRVTTTSPFKKSALPKIMKPIELFQSSFEYPPATAKLDQTEYRSRAPFIPSDLDLVSVTSENSPEESSKLGNKIHNIIDSMFIETAPVLTVVSEDIETDSVSNESEIIMHPGNIHRVDESVDSDYPVNILEDKNITTAVEMARHSTGDTINTIQRLDSMIELGNLDNELYRCVSRGSFRKNQRIKKLPLTPKQSVQQVFLLNRGDGASVILKSTLSQAFQVSNVESRPSPNISQVIPFQVATVGYAFPQYRYWQSQCEEPLNLSEDCKKIESSSETLKFTMNKTCQCFRGQPKEVFGAALASEIQAGYKKKEIQNFASNHQLHAGEQIVPNVVSDVLDVHLQTDATIKPPDEIRTPLFMTDVHDKVQNKLKSESNVQIKESDSTEIPKNNTTTTMNSVDCTSSLDVLVELLNEIQKISECQTHITNKINEKSDSPCHSKDDNVSDNANIDKHYGDDTQDLGKLTSSKKLYSDTTVNAFYTPKLFYNERDRFFNNAQVKTVVDDKEVGVNFNEREYTSKCTDNPSLFPLTINRSTTVSSSFLEIFSRRSSQSLFSYINDENSFTVSMLKTPKQLDLQVTSEKENGIVSFHNKLTSNVGSESMITFYDTNSGSYDQISKQDSKEVEDILKMKRDILVTVYSILVITVFAALSFPEILNNV